MCGVPCGSETEVLVCLGPASVLLLSGPGPEHGFLERGRRTLFRHLSAPGLHLVEVRIVPQVAQLAILVEADFFANIGPLVA